MVLPRGSASWRRMSRFRRQSLVKPLAAEVLEPRCLMTDATGTLAATDAAPLTGAVVVNASLWDDAGLTLQQIGDLLHVFRTDTQTDVIKPMLASEITSLSIIGRNNAADVLTIDLSFGWSLSDSQLSFDGGSGSNINIIEFVNAKNDVNWGWDSMSYQVARIGSGTVDAGGVIWQENSTRQNRFGFELRYDNVGLIQDQIVSRSSKFWYHAEGDVPLWNTRDVSFGSEVNQVTLDILREDGVTVLIEAKTQTIIEFAPRPTIHEHVDMTIGLGAGDDRFEMIQSAHRANPAVADPSVQTRYIRVYCEKGDDIVTNRTPQLMGAMGDSGNDTLQGGSGYDALRGEDGDDLLLGGDGPDALEPGSGNNTVNGGDGSDYLGYSPIWDDTGGEFRLTSDELNGPMTNTKLESIESAVIYFSGGYSHLVDASRFGGPVDLTGGAGSDTLIGTPFDDGITDYDGDTNLVVGGGGADHFWVGRANTVFGDRDPKDIIDWIDVWIEAESQDVSQNGDSTPIADGDDAWDLPSSNDVLLIGQGIATVGIEDRELAEFDTASSDSAFGELADSEPEEGDALAANGDTNSADMGEGLELDAALSDDFLKSLDSQPPFEW